MRITSDLNITFSRDDSGFMMSKYDLDARSIQQQLNDADDHSDEFPQMNDAHHL